MPTIVGVGLMANELDMTEFELSQNQDQQLLELAQQDIALEASEPQYFTTDNDIHFVDIVNQSEEQVGLISGEFLHGTNEVGLISGEFLREENDVQLASFELF